MFYRYCIQEDLILPLTAISKGIKMGRPRVANKQLEFALDLYKSQEMSIRKICEVTGVAKATLCRRLKEIKEEPFKAILDCI